MTPKSGTLVIPTDFGTRWNRSGISELATALESRLQQPVGICFPDDPVETFSLQIRSCVGRGIRRIVVLPLGAVDVTQSQLVAQKLNEARQTAADVHFHAMDPLSWIEWTRGIRQFAIDSIVSQGLETSKTGIIVVARGGQNPLEDADLPRISYLIACEGLVQNVTYAFLDERRPEISHAMSQLVQNGAKEVLVIPWLANDQTLVEIEQATALAGTSAGVTVAISQPTLIHPLLLDLFVCKHTAGCWDNKLQRHLEFVAQFKDLDSASSFSQDSNANQTPEVASQLAELDRKLNAMLPPEYQGQYESVPPTSMGTAGLKYDSEGKIAWDEIWTSFCDLALAGGPPHRGTLLEAVTSAEVLAEPEQYQSVVKEIERGIRMVTGLPLITSRSLGWVGVICESEEMAVWLMRAIIVENVMVRREGDILYLPAGPKFTVKREIKNVITAIAKTVHYWKAHLFANRQPREGN